MILIRIAAILGLGLLIEAALSAQPTKSMEKIDQVTLYVSANYAEFMELCEQEHIRNGLANPKVLLKHQQEILFMQTFQAVNAHQAADLKDIINDAKKFHKAAYLAKKANLIEKYNSMNALAINLERFYAFARMFRVSYRMMHKAIKLKHMISADLEIFKNAETQAPAKIVALNHQARKKSPYPIIGYVETLDAQINSLYKLQRRPSLKESVYLYMKDATIQAELLQNELIKSVDYAIEHRMYALDTARGKTWVGKVGSDMRNMLAVFGGAVLAVILGLSFLTHIVGYDS